MLMAALAASRPWSTFVDALEERAGRVRGTAFSNGRNRDRDLFFPAVDAGRDAGGGGDTRTRAVHTPVAPPSDARRAAPPPKRRAGPARRVADGRAAAAAAGPSPRRPAPAIAGAQESRAAPRPAPAAAAAAAPKKSRSRSRSGARRSRPAAAPRAAAAPPPPRRAAAAAPRRSHGFPIDIFHRTNPVVPYKNRSVVPKESAQFPKLRRCSRRAADVVVWRASTQSICVLDKPAFCKILPRYFKLSYKTGAAAADLKKMWDSFVRQLNYYGFHKRTRGTTSQRAAAEAIVNLFDGDGDYDLRLRRRRRRRRGAPSRLPPKKRKRRG
ncbi:hypothetical protein JL720_12838 [Aureococcus anophagefferens]|nr:hypothetical protein JL720_12838 [Aureococcus anophagefferens]